jgi:TPR repeat protein
MNFVLRRREELTGDELPAALNGSPQQSARLIVSAASQGIVEAQVLLGQILLDGNGISKDPVLAVTWFQIAANNGNAMASNMLGRCLEYGWGCSANASAAAARYKTAAQAGLDWGLYNLANLLATGRGVAEDQHAAFSLYERAANLGHAKSMNLLGRFYEEGRVVPANRQIAHEWYRRSAEAGDFRGQFSHAAVLAEHHNIEQACFWLTRALEGGNLNFLRVARDALLQSQHETVRRLAHSYFVRAAELGDDSDRQAHQACIATLAAQSPQHST